MVISSSSKSENALVFNGHNKCFYHFFIYNLFSSRNPDQIFKKWAPLLTNNDYWNNKE